MGLPALLGAPMAGCNCCGERDGGIGHGKTHSRTELAGRLSQWRTRPGPFEGVWCDVLG